MKPLKQLIAIILLASFTFSGLAAQLTPEQQQAKKQGNIYWYQYNPKALPLLLVAAQVGDEESQYNLAEYMSGYGEQLPKEYQNNAYWYEAAANQGNVYAMYRLNQLCENYSQLKQCHNSTDHWSKTAMDTLKPKIAANEPEALYQYYIFTRDIDYLKKSAEANFPEGQYRYAKYLENKQDKKGAFKWYKKAADDGHIKSSYIVSIFYSDDNILDKAQQYFLVSINAGYIDAISDYIIALSKDNSYIEYGFNKDLVKAYIFTLIMNEVNGQSLPFVKETDLTSEQVKEAKAFAEKWQKEHPPLSYYPSPVFNGSLDR